MPEIDPDKKRLTRITTSPLSTPVLRREVESLGYAIQDEDHVAVHVGATLHEAMRLCLQLRTALHVYWLIRRFRCPSPKALYTHTASFPWEQLIANDSSFSVVSSVDNPKITNTMYPNLVVKDAIVDRILKKTGARPDSGPDRSRVVIHLAWKGDRAWLYLSLNGRRLADRGYRRMPHTAPMQETLAATVVLAAGYDGSAPLVNPMCGAGTIAIEAALLAAGRAPGLLRDNYSIMHTRLHDEGAWKQLRTQLRRSSPSSQPAPIIASDHDPDAVAAAQLNARTAGVDHLIDFHRCDFADTPLPEQPGIVMMNPEYGSRLGDEADLQATYQRLGDFLKQRCAGWTGFVFTGNRDLAKRIGLQTTRRIPFMNAQIECRLLEYEMYVGSQTPRTPADA